MVFPLMPSYFVVMLGFLEIRMVTDLLIPLPYYLVQEKQVISLVVPDILITKINS